MKVALYARVSTAEQTADNQVFELRRYCEARGWAIAEEFVDHGVSGAKDSRPALDALMAAARRRRVDAVVVWRLDRLGRSLRHLLLTLDELTSRGVAFVSLGEGIDTGTAAGRLQLHILGALAEFERERIRERVVLGLQRARRQGRVLGRPRQQPPTGATLADCSGLSVREAARVLGVSRSTAQRLLAAGRPKSHLGAA
ncbi:MAG: recombinase family protein [Acidobacteria bacterium]|nr:recombinase family protein [Acidobacteriota bacterium]